MITMILTMITDKDVGAVDGDGEGKHGDGEHGDEEQSNGEHGDEEHDDH